MLGAMVCNVCCGVSVIVVWWMLRCVVSVIAVWWMLCCGVSAVLCVGCCAVW